MDKEQLQMRAERRRRFIQAQQDAQDSLVAEIGRHWLQKAVQRWDPTKSPTVPDGVPVGEGFKKFVKDFLKSNQYRTLEFGDGMIDAGAEAVASWIDYNGAREVGVDYPNPLSEVDKDKGQGWVIAHLDRKAAHIYDSLDDQERHRTMYGLPEEWARTCPEHAGIQMRRISDGVYQCPMSGDTYSYTDGHNVEYRIGVHNQTNPSWNDTWPQPAFLTSPNQQSTRASGSTHEKIEPERDFGSSSVTADDEYLAVLPTYGKKEDNTKFTSNTPDLYSSTEQMKEAGVKGFMKKAAPEYGVADNLFGKTTLHSRYCPDHDGVSLYRLADNVFQCPLDRTVYDYSKGFQTQDGVEHNGGSVADMTPDWPEFYQSPHPFVQITSSVRGMMKRKAYTNLEYRLARDMDRALRGDEEAARVLGLVSDGVFNRGKPLMDSVRDAYEYIEQQKMGYETPTPTHEVSEEELDMAAPPVM